MPSADFCLITDAISDIRAARQYKNGPPVRQISPDKNMNFHCTTAAFTLILEPVDFVILC